MDGGVTCMLMHGRCCDAAGEPELLEGPVAGLQSDGVLQEASMLAHEEAVREGYPGKPRLYWKGVCAPSI